MSYTQKEYDKDRVFINTGNYKALSDEHALLSAELIAKSNQLTINTEKILQQAMVHAQLAIAFASMVKE